jgi:hypothetical protein
VAALFNPANPATESIVTDVKAAAASGGLEIEVLAAATSHRLHA